MNYHDFNRTSRSIIIVGEWCLMCDSQVEMILEKERLLCPICGAHQSLNFVEESQPELRKTVSH